MLSQTEINLDDKEHGDDSSVESMKDVHLNDGEEERAKDNDDEFDEEIESHVRATEPPPTTPKMPEKHMGRRKSSAPKRPWNAKKDVEKSGSSRGEVHVGEKEFRPIPMPKRRIERARIKEHQILFEDCR